MADLAACDRETPLEANGADFAASRCGLGWVDMLLVC
jgi:hypothetical protein